MKILHFLFNRLTIILLLVFLQITLFILMITYVSSFWQWNVIFTILSITIVMGLISKDDNPTYRMAWIIPILIFPVVGGAFYLFYRYRNISSKSIKKHLEIERNRKYFIQHIEPVLHSKEANYLLSQNFKSYEHTKTLYLDAGEKVFKSFLEDIKAAKSFIFLEFFIIKKGKMWNELLTLLKEKAREGVEIKLIYDDFGASKMPINLPKQLKAFNISAYKFNPMSIRINFGNNYRNHRKIIVIDNKVGYSMGCNIGDEYINLESPLGHWLDTGIRLEGDAVWAMTLMFLDVLNFISDETIDFNRYDLKHAPILNDGYIIPFSDTPLDKEEVTKNVYLSLIYSATKSLKITTPYLIIDPEFKHAIRLAAKSGVDVSIIIPKTPDKKYVYWVTKSHLPALLKDGVNIYTYTPGFMHAKMMIVDGKKL